MADFNFAAGSIGQSDGSVQQSMEVTNVRESATGLSADLSFSTDTLTKTGEGELFHHNRVFKKEIDVVLAKPTQITDESRLVLIGDAAKVGTAAMPPLKITVMATKI